MLWAEARENPLAKQPMLPIESTDPTEPIERIDPWEPMHKNESVDHSDQREPDMRGG